MNIEDVQKYADAGAGLAVHLSDGNVGHLAVGGRDDGALLGGNVAFGIAEKPQKERRQQEGKHRQHGMDKPAEQQGNRTEGQPVISSRHAPWISQ